MILCVNFFWPSKIICSLILIQNMFIVWVLGTKSVKNLIFGRFGLNSSVFEKFLNSYLCISFLKQVGLSGFCIKFPFFFKNFTFLDFRSIEAVFQLIEIVFKILVWIYMARSLLDWCSINRIYFLIDWSPILTDRNSKVDFLKKVLFTCSSLFQSFSKPFITFPLWTIQSKDFLSFSSTNFSKVFVLKHW